MNILRLCLLLLLLLIFTLLSVYLLDRYLKVPSLIYASKFYNVDAFFKLFSYFVDCDALEDLYP